MLSQILKDYGALIGPFLAFFLGVMAILIKNFLDAKFKTQQNKNKLRNLSKVIENLQYMSKYYENEDKKPINLTNLNLLNANLLALEDLFDDIKRNINEGFSFSELKKFFVMKGRYNYLLQEIRNTKHFDITQDDYFSIKGEFEALQEASRGDGYIQKYVEED